VFGNKMGCALGGIAVGESIPLGGIPVGVIIPVGAGTGGCPVGGCSEIGIISSAEVIENKPKANRRIIALIILVVSCQTS
jgi:hypothetical protein